MPGENAGCGRAGRTVLFVSHNMGTVASLCGNGVLLSQGRVAAMGSAKEVLQRYQSGETKKASSTSIPKDGEVAFNFLRESLKNNFLVDFSISLTLKEIDTVRDLSILLYTSTGVRLLIADLRESLKLPLRLSPGEYHISGSFSPVKLVEQEYEVGLYLSTDHFSGNLMSIYKFQPPPLSVLRSPYPASSRGFIDVETSGSIQ